VEKTADRRTPDKPKKSKDEIMAMWAEMLKDDDKK